MLLATALALTSAVLHAAWNLAAKRSVDPFLAVWAQFLMAGVIGGVVLVGAELAGGGMPAGAWVWIGVSACAHIPYAVALGWAYHHGDFSLAYPVARGGGALLAGIGGVLVLGDDLSAWSVAAILTVVAGMWLLAVGADRGHVAAALVVAAAIGVYTVSDSHAVRTYRTDVYVFAEMLATGVTISAAGLALRQGPALTRIGRPAWRRAGIGAAMSIGAYWLVLIAYERAPVGYVAALRESSVLIAVLAGHRLLQEGRGRTRLAAAGLIVAGLVLLVAAR